MPSIKACVIFCMFSAGRLNPKARLSSSACPPLNPAATIATRITCSWRILHCDGRYYRYIVHGNTENLTVLVCGWIALSVALKTQTRQVKGNCFDCGHSFTAAQRPLQDLAPCPSCNIHVYLDAETEDSADVRTAGFSDRARSSMSSMMSCVFHTFLFVCLGPVSCGSIGDNGEGIAVLFWLVTRY